MGSKAGVECGLVFSEPSSYAKKSFFAFLPLPTAWSQRDVSAVGIEPHSWERRTRDTSPRDTRTRISEDLIGGSLAIDTLTDNETQIVVSVTYREQHASQGCVSWAESFLTRVSLVYFVKNMFGSDRAGISHWQSPRSILNQSVVSLGLLFYFVCVCVF